MLQLLTLTNMRAANAVYASAVARMRERNAASVDAPLLHFCDFLLQTLQREGALPLFQLLRRRYAPALSRAGFAPLLDVVAFHFYAVPMPQQAQSANPMMAMMQRMMSGGN